jgi:hypothetical protein
MGTRNHDSSTGGAATHGKPFAAALRPADVTAPKSWLPANRANDEVGKPPSRSSRTSLEARHRGPSSSRRTGPRRGPRVACTFRHQVTKRGPPNAPNDIGLSRCRRRAERQWLRDPFDLPERLTGEPALRDG